MDGTARERRGAYWNGQNLRGWKRLPEGWARNRVVRRCRWETRASFRTRAELQAEILALRHQLAVLQQTAPRRLRLSRADRLFWVLLALFAWHWRWRSAQSRLGRPPIAVDVRAIQEMRRANPVWGAPRIHGELQKHRWTSS